MGRPRLTNAGFIQRSQAMYGDLYRYGRTKYRTMRDTVIITCPIHGDFEVLAQQHLNPRHSTGCSACGHLGKSLAIRRNIITPEQKMLLQLYQSVLFYAEKLDKTPAQALRDLVWTFRREAERRAEESDN